MQTSAGGWGVSTGGASSGGGLFGVRGVEGLGQLLDGLGEGALLVAGFGEFVSQGGAADEAVGVGDALEEVGGEAEVGEGVADFLHFTDPAAGTGRDGGEAAGHTVEDGGLAVLEFGEEGFGEAHEFGGGEELGVEGGGAFGHSGVAHFDAGGLAEVAGEGADVEAEVAELGEVGGVLAGGVEVRAVAGFGRAADDGYIDEAAAGVGDDGGELAGELGGDGVTFGKEGAVAGIAEGGGDVGADAGDGGGDGHGHYEVGLPDEVVEGGDFLDAGFLGKGAGAVGAAGEAGDDLEFVFAEALADGVAHIAGAEDGDGVDGHWGSSPNGGILGIIADGE